MGRFETNAAHLQLHALAVNPKDNSSLRIAGFRAYMINGHSHEGGGACQNAWG
jgi:hypothetical protein